MARWIELWAADAAHGRREPPARRAARGVGPSRHKVRLWLPLTALFVLLSPLALLAALIAWLPLRLVGLHAFAVAFALGGLLIALGGTLVEVDAAEAQIRIKII